MTSTSRRSSGSHWSAPTRSGTVRVVSTDRSHGDFHLDRVAHDVLELRRRDVVDLPWTMLDEVHGTTAVSVDEPGAADRATGDVLVSEVAGAALGVWVGDCAPVVVASVAGRFAVVHAGWRGLAAGVLDVAADLVGEDPPVTVTGYLGPCIRPCCYEFGADDLDRVARSLHLDPATITATTSWGTPSLDVPAAVSAALARRGVVVDDAGVCTGCGGAHFSHRVRADPERHAVVAWKELA